MEEVETLVVLVVLATSVRSAASVVRLAVAVVGIMGRLTSRSLIPRTTNKPIVLVRGSNPYVVLI